MPNSDITSASTRSIRLATPIAIVYRDNLIFSPSCLQKLPATFRARQTFLVFIGE